MTGTLETTQYNATLAITGAIKGKSKENLYNKLCTKYLRDMTWIQKLSLS